MVCKPKQPGCAPSAPRRSAQATHAIRRKYTENCALIGSQGTLSVQTMQVGYQRKLCAVRLPTTISTGASTLVLLVLTFLGCLLTGCSTSDSPPIPKDLDAIQHTVFVISENHTFDNSFGTFPGADGARSGLLSNGQW